MALHPDLLDALSALDDRAPAMREAVLDWSAINSGTGNLAGLERTAAAILPRFEAAGFEAATLPPAGVTEIDAKGRESRIERGPVHLLTANPRANRRVLMTGHLDTVFPEGSHFQEPVDRGDGTLHGPGVADMKGGVCVMLEAASAFLKTPYAEHLGIDVVLNSDEETGSHASAHVLHERALRADVGLVYEPALPDGTLAGARAGSGHYTFTLRGRAAHAGREFEMGRNAILGAARLMEAIDRLNGQRDGVTLNLGLISGGQATNVVPDLCIVRMNVRGRRTEDLAWVDAEIRRVTEEGNAEEGFGDGIRAELHGGIHRPVKEMKGGTAALFEAVRRAGGDIGIGIDWKPTGGCCDGNNLAAAGLPNVDTLGVVGGKIHSDEEYAVLDSFVPRAKLSLLLLMLLASGEVAWPERLSPKAAA
jgi:glutamate carboxypeptidase